jgi:hypothetical protein
MTAIDVTLRAGGSFVVASMDRGTIMFERTFQWTIRIGSRVLFAMAALAAALSLSMNMWNAFHESYLGRDKLLVLAAGLFAALKDATIPLVAAIVIEHFRPRAL